jgi:hypothetical protein
LLSFQIQKRDEACRLGTPIAPSADALPMSNRENGRRGQCDEQLASPSWLTASV